MGQQMMLAPLDCNEPWVMRKMRNPDWNDPDWGKYLIVRTLEPNKEQPGAKALSREFKVDIAKVIAEQEKKSERE